MAAEFAMPESRKAGGIAFDFPVSDLPALVKVPRRVRQRLLENKIPLSVEEIEAKLNEAELRRQQFHELLSSKARPKKINLSRSSHCEGRKLLEAKLYAAGQKRLGILARAQLRLARLDELRKAARVAVQKRCQEEQEVLGKKIGLRAQQAELNRLLLQSRYMQRRAAVKEKTDKLKIQRKLRESQYKEQVQAAILQKSAAAEKKRLSFLEAEKLCARARVMEAQRVALAVSYQRQIARRKLKCQIDDRLQMATRQRTECLLLGRACTHVMMNLDKMEKYGDLLARKLARLWKQFVRLKRTTFDLVKSYENLGISDKSVVLMPFEQLASSIESNRVLQTSKALLERLELRLTLSQPKSPSLANIDDLLKQLSLSNGRGRPSKSNKINEATKGSHKKRKSPMSKRLSRYPSRVVLCAYMIHAHPDEVCSGRGKSELALAKSAFYFIQEFELLIKIILNYDNRRGSGGQSNQSPSYAEHCSDVSGDGKPLTSQCQRTFRSQLLSFDAAWCSYLRHFVEWKVEDSKLLVEDLAQAASQVNLIVNQGYEVSPKEKLLFKSASAVSGKKETVRLDKAMPDITLEDKEEKIEQSLLSSASPFLFRRGGTFLSFGDRRVSNQSSAILDNSESEPGSSLLGFSTVPCRDDGQIGSSKCKKSVSMKEVLAHEIIHEVHKPFVDSLEVGKDPSYVEGKIRETMEKAFWDGIEQDLNQDVPDYSRLVELAKEVRDELCEMAPKKWSQEIIDSVDPDILHQVLKSENPDLDYLGRVLRYALITLQKLSAPANEEEIKKRNSEVLDELGEIARANHTSGSSFVVAIVKGLRSVLEQIKTLKQEISIARIRLLEPVVRGPGGIDYLRKAFNDHYGDPSNAFRSLPLTKLWVAVSRRSAENEWIEHVESFCFSGESKWQLGTPSHDLTPTTLKTGGALPMASNMNLQASLRLTSTENHQPECKGETVDLLVRIGLLKLVNQIEGLKHEILPETLKLNCLRLRTVQGHLQKIIVLITSMLILRQMLLTESIDSKHIDIESVVADSTAKIFQLLDRDPNVGVAKIAETICELPSAEGLEGSWKKIREGKEMMVSMLQKSLRDDDPVFRRVIHAVYLATRGVVLGGSGAKGRKLAERALRSVGATLLLDKLVKAAEVVVLVATVSVRVHGPWYSALLQPDQNLCE